MTGSVKPAIPARTKTRTVRVLVNGIVQGVCFREYTRRKALDLELIGWVRNLADGSVEVLVSGPPERVGQMVAWLHRGSPYASVKQVDVQEEPESPAQSSFRITY